MAASRITFGYRRSKAMRAMHRAVARTYAFTTHTHQATTKVLHHMSYYLPAKRCEVARRVGG